MGTSLSNIALPANNESREIADDELIAIAAFLLFQRHEGIERYGKIIAETEAVVSESEEHV